MADLPPYRDSESETRDDPDVGPDRGSTHGMPLWVKVFGIIALVLVLMVVTMLVIGGNHGPGRHFG
ncbi:MAG: hypothetical protein M3R70_07970 [Actinomycetota bacterium]|nr:hypothetical protein [Actinomycetota bacterium]